MRRRLVVAGCLLLAATAVFAEDRRTVLAGKVAAPDPGGNLLVVDPGSGEILHDGPVGRGKFRVDIPRPEGSIWVLFTVPNAGPDCRQIAVPGSRAILREPLTPAVATGHARIRVRAEGQRVSGARVVYRFRPRAVPLSMLPLLGGETVTDPKGVAVLPRLAGARLEVRIEHPLGHWSGSIPQSDEAVPVFLSPPTIEPDLRNSRGLPLTRDDVVVFGPAGNALERADRKRWYRPAAEGLFRIAATGYRPVVTNLPYALGRFSCRLLAFDDPKRVKGRGLLRVVQTVRPQPKPPIGGPRLELMCGTTALHSTPSRARARLVGGGPWIELAWHRVMGALEADLAPGAYDVETIGRLGVLRSSRATVEADEDRLVQVPVDGGSAIRIVARNDRGDALETVSFALFDADGKPAKALFEPPPRKDGPPVPPTAEEVAARRRWPEPASRFAQVANGGRILLGKAGEWKLDVVLPGAEAERVTLRTHAGMVTRVEVGGKASR